MKANEIKESNFKFNPIYSSFLQSFTIKIKRNVANYAYNVSMDAPEREEVNQKLLSAIRKLDTKMIGIFPIGIDIE